MRTPITYYGGKLRLIKELLPLIPAHEVYVEAFTGGGALFFAKPPSKGEIINDLNGNVTNFYRVAQSDFEELKKMVDGTLHSRALYKEAKEIYDNPEKYNSVSRAWAFWVATNQGFSGKIGSWALAKNDNKIGKTLANKRDGFTHEYAARLKHVQIESKDALKVIQHYDSKDTFFYLDPPYFNSDCGHYKGYTESDYRKLLDTVISIKGKFLLSSYPSDILKEYIKKYGWYYKEIHQKVKVTHLTKKEKIEVLAWNYDIPEALLNSENTLILKPKENKPAINYIAKKAVNSYFMHFSDEKSKHSGSENLRVNVKYTDRNLSPVPKEVLNFDNRKENLEDRKQLSLERCRKVLEQSGAKYSDEEIWKIRKLLYKLGNLDYQLFKELKTKQHDKCNYLRKSVDRRASRQRHKYALPKRTAGAVLHPDGV